MMKMNQLMTVPMRVTDEDEQAGDRSYASYNDEDEPADDCSYERLDEPLWLR